MFCFIFLQFISGLLFLLLCFALLSSSASLVYFSLNCFALLSTNASLLYIVLPSFALLYANASLIPVVIKCNVKTESTRFSSQWECIRSSSNCSSSFNSKPIEANSKATSVHFPSQPKQKIRQHPNGDLQISEELFIVWLE